MALKKKASMLASLLVFLTLLNFSAGLYFENVTVIFSVRSYIQSAFVCAFLSTCIEIFCALSLCTALQIRAQVTNHLSETTLVMKVHNDGACPTEDTFDLQLPVTSFLSEMILTEEKTKCTFNATFLAAEKAQASFDGAVKVLRNYLYWFISLYATTSTHVATGIQ